MTSGQTFWIAAVAVVTMSLPVFAEDAAFELPEQCVAGMAGMDHSAMGHDTMGSDQGTGMGTGMGGGMMGGMMGMEGMDLSASPEHVQENMRKMMITMPAMHEGMMNEDADVAFACGMIAHHQGAIDMAQVLLTHGDDPKMRALAEEIIAAQVGEIKQMTDWLAETAK